jgi:hypothetical protein
VRCGTRAACQVRGAQGLRLDRKEVRKMIRAKARREKLRVKLNPPVGESRPRPVKLNGGGICLMWVALILLGASVPVGAWIFTIAERDRVERQALDRDAIGVKAEVTELTRTRGENSRYYARFRFLVDGRVYENRSTVPQGRWKRLKVGSPLDVVYLSSDPLRSWARGREPKGIPLWLGPIVGLCMLLAGGCLLLPILRQKRLLSEGRHVRGRVTTTKKVHEGHQVEFEFRLLSGAVRSGKFGPVSKPPAVGDSVEMIYDPENPSHSAQLPLSLVTVQNDVLGR